MSEDRMEERLHDAISELEMVAHSIKPPEAWREFGELTTEQFYRVWPDVGAWGQWLWQLIDHERGDKAAPIDDSDLDESGSAG
jgi:hypothetical protein